jgi:hypothetical protein
VTRRLPLVSNLGTVTFFLLASTEVRYLSFPPRALTVEAMGSGFSGSLFSSVYFIEAGSWLIAIDLTGVPILLDTFEVGPAFF